MCLDTPDMVALSSRGDTPDMEDAKTDYRFLRDYSRVNDQRLYFNTSPSIAEDSISTLLLHE